VFEAGNEVLRNVTAAGSQVFRVRADSWLAESGRTSPARPRAAAWRGGQPGFTYKLNDALTLGGVYQTAGNLPDLKDVLGAAA
jgi:hypothetical protein